ncbi:MAG TPA: hypothetical protein VJV78_31610, partial [Polyangiales bacterium]|nr:hypothetical protein [Polyangiales bacterium]
PGTPRIALVFGERLPSVGAVRDLVAEPEFRRALERGAQAAGSILDCDMLPALLAPPEPKCRTLNAVDAQKPWLEFPQTSAVLIHYALHATFERWGVTPSAAYGCGVGEYSAACAAGVLDWLDALRLCARRELLLGSLVPGGRVRQTLHQFKSALSQIGYESPNLPLIAASIDGEPRGTLDRAHWLEHLYARTEPLRGVAALRRLSPDLYLDLGPANPAAISGMPERNWLACATPEGSTPAHLLQVLAALYEHGADMDFRAFHDGFEHPRLDLPSYPFQRQRCWLEFNRPHPPAHPPRGFHPFLGSKSSA